MLKTFFIVLKSTATTKEPAATKRKDSWHFKPTGAPGTEVIPTQQEELEDEVAVSQSLT